MKGQNLTSLPFVLSSIYFLSRTVGVDVSVWHSHEVTTRKQRNARPQSLTGIVLHIFMLWYNRSNFFFNKPDTSSRVRILFLNCTLFLLIHSAKTFSPLDLVRSFIDRYQPLRWCRRVALLPLQCVLSSICIRLLDDIIAFRQHQVR